MTGLWVTLAVLVLATVGGLAWQRRNGRFRTTTSDGLSAPYADLLDPTAEVTLLQLSSPVCAPCRATAALAAELVAEQPGLRHVEVDVSERVDLARDLDVLRTPTVLVLDRAGRERSRASGLPTREALTAAVAAAR